MKTELYTAFQLSAIRITAAVIAAGCGHRVRVALGLAVTHEDRPSSDWWGHRQQDSTSDW